MLELPPPEIPHLNGHPMMMHSKTLLEGGKIQHLRQEAKQEWAALQAMAQQQEALVKKRYLSRLWSTAAALREQQAEESLPKAVLAQRERDPPRPDMSTQSR